jgi:cysteine desulfurase
MGVPPELARGAVRLSLGPTTTQSDIDRAIQAWIRISSALLKGTRGIAA